MEDYQPPPIISPSPQVPEPSSPIGKSKLSDSQGASEKDNELEAIVDKALHPPPPQGLPDLGNWQRKKAPVQKKITIIGQKAIEGKVGIGSKRGPASEGTSKISKPEIDAIIAQKSNRYMPRNATNESDTQHQRIVQTCQRVISVQEQVNPKGFGELRTLGGSANPVVQVREEFMIPAEKFPKMFSGMELTSQKKAEDAFTRTFQKAQAGLPMADQNQIGRTFNSQIRPTLSKLAGMEGAEVHTVCIDLIRSLKYAGLSMGAYESLEKAIGEMQAHMEPFRLEGMTQLYSKEEVLQCVERGGFSETLVQQIRDIPDNFVSHEQLTEATLGKVTKQIINLIAPPATAQYSFMEAMARGNYRKEVESALVNIPGIVVPGGFAFKAQEGHLGNENLIEMRAQDHNRLIKMTDFLLLKTEEELPGMAITTGKGVRMEAPIGIVSRFLTDGTDLNAEDWMTLTNLRARVNADNARIARGENAQVPEQERTQLAELEAKAKTEVGSQSTMQHAMMDLELFAGDNHTEQYKIVAGEAYCYDFARLLPPGIAEIRGNKTFCNLKSAFLDHPHCQDPIPEAMVQAFLARDLNAEMQLLREQNMIGDRAFYNMAADRMEQQEIDNAAVAKLLRVAVPNPFQISQAQRIARRYGVATKGKTIQQYGLQICSAIRDERIALKKACLLRDHPIGHEMRYDRVQKMQEYLGNCQQNGTPPTVDGMKNYVLADTLAPILKVYERLNGHPTMNIGITHDLVAHSGQPISLEDIIAKAEAENLATPDEVEEMKQALDNIKNKACTPKEMRTVAFSF